jgi:hypothetical protein
VTLLLAAGDAEAVLAFLLFAAFMVVVSLLAIQANAAQRRRSVRELEALAGLLEGGAAHTAKADFWSGLDTCRAEGRLEGHDVRVSFARRGGGKHAYTAIVYAVEVHHPASAFEVAEVDAIEGLFRFLGLSSTDKLRDGNLVLRKGGAPAGRLLQATDVRAAMKKVLDSDGVSAVSLKGTTLTIEQRGHIQASSMHTTLRTLLELARLVGRRRVDELKIVVSPREATPAVTPRFAWTGGGETARCPYCRDELDAAAPEAAACDRCGTVHHRECLDEAGGCTVFGCGAKDATAERARS